MTQDEWQERVESGKCGAAKIAVNLCGRAFWGAEVKSLEVNWDKRTVCMAQDWRSVEEKRENYDFVVSAPACKKCKYYSECQSDKPYTKQVVEERHEAKTNYSTYMANKYGDRRDGTQNIYIEIIQNYRAWLKATEEEKDGHLGWYHEKFKGIRPEWYHFYQPVVDPEGKGKYIDKADKSKKQEREAFCIQAQPGDSLVTENPWGYILSITAKALDELINKLETKNRVIPRYDNYHKDVLIAKLIPVADIVPDRRSIIFTPVFTEVGIDGEQVSSYPIRERFIPKHLKDKIVTPMLDISNISDITTNEDGQISIKTGSGGIGAFLVKVKELKTPPPYYKGSPKYGKDGTPYPYYSDLDRMELFEWEGGRDNGSI